MSFEHQITKLHAISSSQQHKQRQLENRPIRPMRYTNRHIDIEIDIDNDLSMTPAESPLRPLFGARESSSSKKMTDGEAVRARLNTARKTRDSQSVDTVQIPVWSSKLRQNAKN